MAPVITHELLAQLGLSITPARDHGFGYTWRGRQWVGPFDSEYDALQAAFGEAITIMNTEKPNAQVAGELWRYTGATWEYVGYQEPEIESEAQSSQHLI